MKIHKPKTIQEAIDDLQVFLESDLYSKFRPIEEIKGKEWIREDYFKDEKEFYNYLNQHFNILKEQIKELEKQK
ncbi:MAG TPA: hypothetical protein VMZ91_07130 [Candidatus Paceibacterota bacterium]|nr:hypothetical protein [Candidatus Paceibacterota bacterium]